MEELNATWMQSFEAGTIRRRTSDLRRQERKSCESNSSTSEQPRRRIADDSNGAARATWSCLPAGCRWGWRQLAEGNVLPALLGMLGLSLIGGASLWRSLSHDAAPVHAAIHRGTTDCRRRVAPRSPAPRPAEHGRSACSSGGCPGFPNRPRRGPGRVSLAAPAHRRSRCCCSRRSY